MTVVRTVVLGIGVLAISATLARAADSADAKGSPPPATPTVKAAPTGGTPQPAAAKVDTTGIKAGIVGKWKSVDDGEIMNFGADGALHVQDPNTMFIGTYQFLDDGELQLDIPVFANQRRLVYKVELKDTQLTMTAKDRNPRKYDLVK